jgi:glycosyltransferase involved in cell wall biosynthesis
LATALEAQGYEVKIAYGRENVPEQFQKYAVRIGADLDVKLHGIKARLFDASGFGSKAATVKFIRWVKKYDPDVIHLHNIHGYYINVEVLFDYLRTCGKRIIWTLHDCWAFTGHSSYCDAIQCKKWKSGCSKCPQIQEYPKSLLDRSEQNWAKKKRIFTGIPDMTLVTPSQWLAGLVRESFLKEYPVEVIHNGIDTNVFKPTEGNLREIYQLEHKKIILGVAANWDRRKGLDTFIELSRYLSDNYQIILVGLNEKQLKKLPDSIMGISNTNNIRELAELYTLADVFVNPTYEDNYPTTNLEAIACGTPVITYDTGGSPESANIFGQTVTKGSIDEMIMAIENVENINFNKKDKLDKAVMLQQYLALF